MLDSQEVKDFIVKDVHVGYEEDLKEDTNEKEIKKFAEQNNLEVEKMSVIMGVVRLLEDPPLTKERILELDLEHELRIAFNKAVKEGKKALLIISSE